MIWIVLGFIFLFPSSVLAVDVIEIRTTPETPDAYDAVKIKLSSFTTDLASSQIVWTVDGKVVSDGPSQTEFSVQAKGYGETVLVVADIITPGGERITKQIPVSPIGIDLMWEAQGYTPPFYKGKARPTVFSKVKVAAFPRFNKVSDDPGRYTYSWFIRESTVVGEGLGRSSALVESPRSGQKLDIKVDVQTPDRTSKGIKRLTIRSGDPVVLLYQDAPLLGFRIENALGFSAFPVTSDTAVVRAVPYYFSKDAVEERNLRVTWSLDGATIPSGFDPLEMTVQAPESSGVKNVGIDIRNNQNLFQAASGRAQVGFIRK
jgi:hypothetical protein